MTYTLTSMGCPVGPYIAEQIDLAVQAIDGVEEVESDLVWSPPWGPDRMSDDAKFALGFGSSPEATEPRAAAGEATTAPRSPRRSP